MLTGLTVAVLLTGGSVAPRADVDPAKGTPCRVPAEARTASAVVAVLGEAMGRPLELLRSRRGADPEPGAREVALDRREGSFWEIVGALESASGLELQTLEAHRLRFDAPDERVQWLGEWQVHGVYRLRAFHQGQAGMVFVRLQAEPWLDEVDPGDRRGVLHLGGGRRGKSLEAMADGHMNNESLLDFTFDFYFDLPEGAAGEARLEFLVPMATARSWQDVTLPPLGKLGRKPHTVGKGKDRIQVELDEVRTVQEGDHSRFEVRLAVLGCPLFGDGWLCGPDGAPQDRIYRGANGDEKRLAVTLRFDAAAVPDPDAAVLGLRLPGGWEWVPLAATFEGIPVDG